MTKTKNIFKIAASCAGALVVAGGIIAASVAVSRANAAVLTDETVGTAEATAEETAAFCDIDIPAGRYYRDGDVDSEYWIDVTEDKQLELVGPDIEGEMFKHFKEDMPEESDEAIQEIVDASIEPFLEPKDFRAVQVYGLDQANILIDWVQEGNGISGYGYEYPAENTIYAEFFGTFTLVE